MMNIPNIVINAGGCLSRVSGRGRMGVNIVVDGMSNQIVFEQY